MVATPLLLSAPALTNPAAQVIEITGPRKVGPDNSPGPSTVDGYHRKLSDMRLCAHRHNGAA
jgi:hypothetical protein